MSDVCEIGIPMYRQKIYVKIIRFQWEKAFSGARRRLVRPCTGNSKNRNARKKALSLKKKDSLHMQLIYNRVKKRKLK